MDICMMAIEKEQKMERFYNKLYDKTSNEKLKNIFSLMAKQEKKHAEKFIQITKNLGEEIFTEDVNITPLDTLKIKNILNEIKNSQQTQYLPGSDQKVYHNICELEKESEDYYYEMASKVTDTKLKRLLQRFASEEHEHYLLMCELYEIVRTQTT
ncbi:MAG: ferritin family protein [Oligoflexia bacterium]|nr:ferritin family protein [Oligoflexia bacterium]